MLIAFTSLFLVTSIYGRVYWGVIYYFIGLYLFIENKKPLYLILVALCYVSHTSNLILIALLPLGFWELKRWHLVLIIVLFGSITSLFNDYFNLILDEGGIDGADYLNGKVNSYTTSGQFVFSYWGNSIGEKIIFLLRHVPLIFVLFRIMKIFMGDNKEFKLFDKPFRRIIYVYIGVNLISFVFLFADMKTGTYFYRVLAMSFFPITLILPYLMVKKQMTKHSFNLYIILFLIASEANYLKDMYYAYVAGR